MQGNRILILDVPDQAQQVVMIPPAGEAFVRDAVLFRAVLLEEIKLKFPPSAGKMSL